ncbi:MAG: (d)CMP kinase [Bacteroidetes bacterium]|nr:(d)CMP kinase [Bacteroidota bacterium]
MKKIIIAIDGASASGKSSTALKVAQQLNYMHIDTGSMYRAIAFKVLETGTQINNFETINKIAEKSKIEFKNFENKQHIILDGEDLTEKIRLPFVTEIVSAISAIDGVRKQMVLKQRSLGSSGGVVLEGRDIGTVVFPKAELKFFLTANSLTRAARRKLELQEKGISQEIQDLEKDLIHRDYLDSSREISPLKKAEDAIELDTTNLTLDMQVDFIVQKAKEKINN